jgi:hypothetical protein
MESWNNWQDKRRIFTEPNNKAGSSNGGQRLNLNPDFHLAVDEL